MPRTPTSPRAAVLSAGAGLLLVVAAMVVPQWLDDDVRVHFPPLHADWDPRFGLLTLPAIAIGLAFVVVLHLSPDHESSAAEILQRVTVMPVTQVREPMPIEADSIYIISPTNDLIMDDGHLRVAPSRRARGGAPAAIDLFFRTLAQVHAPEETVFVQLAV